MVNNDEFNESSYWDYISTQEIRTEGDFHIKDLIKDAYNVALPLIHQLMYIESDFVYLNLVCGIPQTTIAEMYGLSQLGVSKRVRGGVKKMKHVLEIPEEDLNRVKADFYNLLPIRCREVAYLYYKYRIYVIVSQITGEKPANIRNIVSDTIQILKAFLDSKGKVCARLTENPYDEFLDKKAYRKKLQDETMLDIELVKAEKYLKYFDDIQNQHNYGNYHFKAQSRDFSRDGGL